MTILLSQVQCIGLKRDLNDSSHSLHSVTQVLDPMLILMGNVIYDETFLNHMKSRFVQMERVSQRALLFLIILTVNLFLYQYM